MNCICICRCSLYLAFLCIFSLKCDCMCSFRCSLYQNRQLQMLLVSFGLTLAAITTLAKFVSAFASSYILYLVSETHISPYFLLLLAARSCSRGQRNVLLSMPARPASLRTASAAPAHTGLSLCRNASMWVANVTLQWLPKVQQQQQHELNLD